MSELKPCPLCGGKAEVWRAHPENPKRRAWVGCMERCVVLITREFETTEDAVKHWNTRTSEAREADLKAKLEKAESEAQKSKNYVQALEDRLHWVLYSGPLNLSENRMQWLHEPFGDDLSSLPRSERQDTSPRCAECGGNGQVSRSFGFIPCEACNGKGF